MPEPVEERVARLEQARLYDAERLTKLEAGLDGIRVSINRGLGLVCLLLGGVVTNLILTIGHVGR